MTAHGTDTQIKGEQLSELELAAWRGLLCTHARLTRALDAELDAAHDLPLVSYDVLLQLEAAPEHRLRMRDLADQVLLSRSGLTRLADRLEREGLIERSRCDCDGRGAYAVITERGLERLREARPCHLAGVRERFLSRFSEPELEQLAAFWARLQG
jgi:DNA-binding MarR family transcriptional regulator